MYHVNASVESSWIEREQSASDGRVAYLRLTAEGETRLKRAFTDLAAERRELRDAFANLDEAP